MDKLLTFTVVGLATAGIYAVIASGLVLTYTTTGVFNFAHGAAGMLGAFCYWQLRFDWGWPTPVALVVVLGVLGPLFGVVLERVIMRGLGETSETVRLVVSISLLIGCIGLAQLIWEPGISRPMRTFFQAADPIRLGPTSITLHQLITIAVAAAVAFGLRALLYRLRLGVAMRATVDDRALARLTGIRPARVAMAAWAIGTCLAALGGILIAPGISLDAPSLSLLIVNAYAAAIFGRLRSLPMTFVGAVVLGVTDAYLTGYLPQNQYLPGLRLASPVLLLFAVLLALPNPRLRGRLRTTLPVPHPAPSGALCFAGLVVLAGVIAATTMHDPDLLTYARVFPVGIIALSLVPLTGYAGQISLCQLSFAGIGAVTMAHLGTDGSPLALLWAACIAAGVGALVALPALRLSGIYLALATAAFAVALDRWIFTLPRFEVFGLFDVALFGQGTLSVAPLEVAGVRFSSPASQMVLMSVTFALASLVVVAVRRSRFGRQLVAMKDSEAACATLGMNLLGTKVAVFALSAGMAGVGGALLGMERGSIAPGTFELVAGLPIFALTVVGGVGTVGGALFAGLSLHGLLPLLAALVPGVTAYLPLLPGLAGIGLGRNPAGAVHDIREGFAPLVRSPRVLGATVGLVVLWWALRLAGWLGNWPFALLVVATPVVVTTAVLYAARPRATDAVPLEWRGLATRWAPGDVEELDRVLGVVVPETAAVASTGDPAAPRPAGLAARSWTAAR